MIEDSRVVLLVWPGLEASFTPHALEAYFSAPLTILLGEHDSGSLLRS